MRSIQTANKPQASSAAARHHHARQKSFRHYYGGIFGSIEAYRRGGGNGMTPGWLPGDSMFRLALSRWRFIRGASPLSRFYRGASGKRAPLKSAA